MANSQWKRGNTFAPREAAPIAKTVKYTEAQEHLLRRLGNALVLQWDALPDTLQDLVIDQAVLVDDRDDALHEREDIEGFIRAAKVVSVKARQAASPQPAS